MAESQIRRLKQLKKIISSNFVIHVKIINIISTDILIHMKTYLQKKNIWYLIACKAWDVIKQYNHQITRVSFFFFFFFFGC